MLDPSLADRKPYLHRDAVNDTWGSMTLDLLNSLVLDRGTDACFGEHHLSALLGRTPYRAQHLKLLDRRPISSLSSLVATLDGLSRSRRRGRKPTATSTARWTSLTNTSAFVSSIQRASRSNGPSRSAGASAP